MGIVERISVVIDSKLAGGGFKGFKAAVSEADTLGGKFKAGWKNVSQQVQANAGALAAGAGAALIAFGIKAVAAFEDTAKAAVDMAKATGLSVEQASRWIAVGDDFGVSAESISTALAKIGKNLDSAAFEKYGIEATTTNGALLDVLETINNTAPLERAAVGQELLGKGYKSLAPLLGKTRAEYEKMLSSVEDGQVITASEARKAERMRLAQDALSDALKDVTLAVGEQVAEFAPLIDKMTQVITLSTSIIPKSDSLKDGIDSLGEAAEASGDAFKYLTDRGYSAAAAVQIIADYRLKTEDATKASKALEEQERALAEATQGAANKTKALNDYLKDQKDAAQDAADSVFDLESAQLDLTEQVDALAEAQKEADRILADSKSTDEQKRQALIDLRQAQIGTAEGAAKAALEFARAQGAQDGSKASTMLQIAELQRLKAEFPLLAADIDKYIAKLKQIPGTVTTNLAIKYGGGSGGTGADGTGVSGDTGNINTGKPGQVQSVSGTRGGSGQNVNISVTLNGILANALETGQAVADALAAYYRNGGERP